MSILQTIKEKTDRRLCHYDTKITDENWEHFIKHMNEIKRTGKTFIVFEMDIYQAFSSIKDSMSMMTIVTPIELFEDFCNKNDLRFIRQYDKAAYLVKNLK